MSEPPRFQPPVIGTPQPPPLPAKPLGNIRVPRPTRLGLHPISAMALLGIDNLFFGAEAITFEMAWPLISLAAFVITGVFVFATQMLLHRDRFWVASAKAMVCGLLAGIPTSISGTVFATLVLAWAGLSKLGQWLGLKRPPAR